MDLRIKLKRVKRWMGQGFAQPIDRAGIKLVENNPDITCLQLAKINEHEIEEDIKNATSSVVILEFTNSTVLNWYHLLDNPKVIGYVKGQIDKKDERDGLYVGWNMALIKMKGNDYTRNDVYFDNDRQIDIHYSATMKVNNPFTKEPELDYYEHRKKALDEVNRICEKYGYTQSGECKAKEYRDKMKQSKICISPFGQGEICHRTFEAIRLGAVPIIPDSSYIETWPDILSSCIQCKHDFSDLELKINTILCSEQKRNKLRYNIVKEAWDNKVFSKRFYNLMEKIYENKHT